MTSEIQTFIDLKDLIGLRFECGNCHERISARLSSESKVMDYKEGFRCPHCRQSWFQGNQDSRLMSLMGFIGHFKDLLAVKEMPFKLTLEISSPAPSLGHASDSKV
jgi:hypothetical protein